jgi:hypothetical protein
MSLLLLHLGYTDIIVVANWILRILQTLHMFKWYVTNEEYERCQWRPYLVLQRRLPENSAR